MSLQDGRKVIAFDFDGVLHEYHGWNGGKLAGPLPGMLYLVDQLRAEGAYVVIHTTRKAEDVAPWLAEHGFPDLPIYHEKWSRIDVFVDDRAVHFTPELTRDGDATDNFARYLLGYQPHWRQPEASPLADALRERDEARALAGRLVKRLREAAWTSTDGPCWCHNEDDHADESQCNETRALLADPGVAARGRGGGLDGGGEDDDAVQALWRHGP